MLRRDLQGFELAHLEQSDLILVDGGDRRRLWDTLSTDLGASEVAEHVKWRYLQGAPFAQPHHTVAPYLCFFCFGACVGTCSCCCSRCRGPCHRGSHVSPWTEKLVLFWNTANDHSIQGLGIFPHIVAPETEETDLEDLVEQLGGAGVVILGIHKGAGMIFNKDGLVEPARHMIQEYRWDWQSSSVKQALLLGPPRTLDFFVRSMLRAAISGMQQNWKMCTPMPSLKKRRKTRIT